MADGVLITRALAEADVAAVAGLFADYAASLDIDLDAVPKKYDGLDGTELAISESQERMAVCIDPADAAYRTLASAHQTVRRANLLPGGQRRAELGLDDVPVASTVGIPAAAAAATGRPPARRSRWRT